MWHFEVVMHREKTGEGGGEWLRGKYISDFVSPATFYFLLKFSFVCVLGCVFFDTFFQERVLD